ncbi:MAG: di-trans,poly-cis-decaprenylcistransferase [Bryobacterales bacterium]|nr:di-trans,poly-cis-decaprenylcistransferase [Bryobacterales bacterium]
MARRLHVAIIMDGNGRWAGSRGWPRLEGHRRGAATLRSVAEAAPGLGVGELTVYAFSSDNWKRPCEEVAGLMRLFAEYLESETRRCVENGIRLRVEGRRDRLEGALVETIERCERRTADGGRMTLRLAVDYSSRHAIAEAASRGRTPDAVPDVDLMIRTAGEQRLSDFLLWESAYAEFWFTKKTWPEFSVKDLELAISEFRLRVRKFGALPAPHETRTLGLDPRRDPLAAIAADA